MFRLFRILLLWPLLVLAAPDAKAQASLAYSWMVTHDSKLTASVLGAEGSRAYLESQLAVERGIESSLWSSTVGSETFSWMRSYAAFIRTLRSFQRVREAIMLTKVPVWTLLPQIGFVAPVQYKDPETGKTLTVEREVASLSVVPPAYQAHWTSADFYQDDEFSGASDVKKGPHTFVTFNYPHKLSDIQLTFSPSPFLSDYAFDEGQAIDDLKAHFYEALMDAAARLAGFGISVNPQVLADGTKLVEGRMTPAQIKAQSILYENQAMTLIDKIHRLYVDHGASFAVADRLVRHDVGYWQGFSTRMANTSSARAMFCMNLMNEVHQAVGRLEAYQRRNKVAETDQELLHIGQKKKPDGTFGDFLEGSNFWDMVDRIAGIPNGGEAVRLQAMGLSARYSRFQFDEAEGWRNVLMGSERMKIAIEGLKTQEKQRVEIESMNRADFTFELSNLFLEKRKMIQDMLNNTGWGGITNYGARS